MVIQRNSLAKAAGSLKPDIRIPTVFITAHGVQRDQERREREYVIAGLRTHYESLTPREREIMTFVASGLISKQIATKFKLSEITVKMHRSRLMKKMGARTVVELLRMAQSLGVTPASRQRRERA